MGALAVHGAQCLRTLTAFSTKSSLHLRTQKISGARLQIQDVQAHAMVSSQAALIMTHSTISFSQSTTDYTPRMEQFHPRTMFTPMIRTWGASWPNSSHLLTSRCLSNIVY